ncbi:MAG: TetR/AcrR family transcriptional regulator [Geminicoccaceae bacterium]
MERVKKKRLSRDDWVRAALGVLEEHGVDGVKIVIIAKRLNATSGSFYWHFKNLQDLLDCLLDYWELQLTDAVIDAAKAFDGPPEERILDLMTKVIEDDASFHDHAILIWARRDPEVMAVFERTMQRRFDFAGWMFMQAGFPERQAAIRGRLMVTYLMGESSASLKSDQGWKDIIRDEFRVLIAHTD